MESVALEKETSVFMSGGSQSVRISAEFQLPAKRVPVTMLEDGLKFSLINEDTDSGCG